MVRTTWRERGEKGWVVGGEEGGGQATRAFGSDFGSAACQFWTYGTRRESYDRKCSIWGRNERASRYRLSLISLSLGACGTKSGYDCKVEGNGTESQVQLQYDELAEMSKKRGGE